MIESIMESTSPRLKAIINQKPTIPIMIVVTNTTERSGVRQMLRQAILLINAFTSLDVVHLSLMYFVQRQSA